MAKAIDTVQLQLKLKGFSAVKSIGKDFEKFQSTVKISSQQLEPLLKKLTQVNGKTVLSKNAFQGQIGVLTNLRNSVGIGTVAYDRLGREIDEVRAKMNALTQSASGQGGIFSKLQARFDKIPVGGRAALGALAGTATSRLGTTGQLAFTGGAVGGPAGAVIGAGIGAAVDTVQAAGAAAKYSAQIQRLEIALKGVTGTQARFNKAQKIISDTSKRLNVPIAAATKQFTQLSASVIGAGGSLDDAKLVFNGVTEAIKATGGGADDVQSAIRAMSQIFGKGKVSAEELQGQLGERLAGAVVKFAEASGRTLQELQKDLRDGTVGLDSVMKFVVKLSKDHKNAAEAMAASSVEAGLRMQVALESLQKEVGDIFVPVGAFFQNIISSIALLITRILKLRDAFNILGNLRGAAGLEKELADIDKQLESGMKKITTFSKGEFGLPKVTYEKLTEEEKAALQQRKKDIDNELKGIEDKSGFQGVGKDQGKLVLEQQKILNLVGQINDEKLKQVEIDFEAAKMFELLGGKGNEFKVSLEKITEALKKGKTETFNFAEEFKKLSDKATDLKSRVGELALDTTVKLADAFADFFIEGKRGFKDLAKSAIQDLTRIIIRATFMKHIANPILGKLNLLPNADGNVIANNKIVPYAKGGLITRPQLFPLSNGAALAGEAGVEAIMPLRRGRNGRLGVEASGGMSNNIIVNVDATGSSVEGDEDSGRQLGQLIATAVQSQLVEEKRPGGLLE